MKIPYHLFDIALQESLEFDRKAWEKWRREFSEDIITKHINGNLSGLLLSDTSRSCLVKSNRSIISCEIINFYNYIIYDADFIQLYDKINTLNYITFFKCSIVDSVFKDIIINKCNLYNCIIYNVEFKSVLIKSCLWNETKFIDCVFTNCHFDNLYWDKNTDLTKSTFVNCSFESNHDFTRHLSVWPTSLLDEQQMKML